MKQNFAILIKTFVALTDLILVGRNLISIQFLFVFCSCWALFGCNVSMSVKTMDTENSDSTTSKGEPPTLSIAGVSISEGSSGLTTLTFTVTSSFISQNNPIHFNYATSDGTALAGSDYTALSGSATIVAGSSSVNLSVPITVDSVDEPNETFTITLSGGSGYTLTGSTLAAEGTITNDDGVVPNVDFSVTSQSISEGAGTATITVNLSVATSQTVTVPFTINSLSTAVGSTTDYSFSPASPLTFSPGVTSQSITVTINNDSLDEANETVIVDLGSPTNASNGTLTTHTLTITDNDSSPTVQWTATNQSSPESTSTVTLTAEISAVSALDVTIPFTINASSTATGAGTDYSFSPASPLTISAGTTTASVTITVVNDTTYEGDETLVFEVGTPINATASGNTNHTITIQDNDLGNFNVSGITGVGDATTDATLSGTGAYPKVNWSASGGATAYKVTIFQNDGTTAQCTEINVGNVTTYQFLATDCIGALTSGTNYYARVISTNGSLDLAASNNNYSFIKNRPPTIDSTGPFYVLAGGALVLNASSSSAPGIASDPDGDTLSFSAVNNGSLGTVTNSTSSLTYTSSSTASTGVDTFTVTVSDTFGSTTNTTLTIHVVTAKTWTGGGGTTNWATAANWCGAINPTYTGCTNVGPAPTAAQIAIFDGTCSSNCSATTTANVSVAGIKLGTGYNGTVTLGGAFTLTIGTSGLTQYAGTFTGGSGAISSTGPISIEGGTFTSTSGTLTITSTNATIASPGVFSHNNGTVDYYVGSGTRTFSAENVDFNNIRFMGWGSTTTLAKSFNVLDTLTLGDGYGGSGSLNGQTITVYGNISLLNYGKFGTTVIKIAGNTNQSVTSSSANAFIPFVEVASTGGTVSWSGTTKIYGNFTHTSGTLDFGTSHQIFDSHYANTRTITAAGLNFYDVTFSGDYAAYNLSSPMNILGTLTLSDRNGDNGSLNNHYINLYGGLSLSNSGKKGTTLIKLVGTNNRTVSGISSATINDFEIATTGGTTTFSGTFNTIGNFTYTSGTVDFGTSTVVFIPSWLQTRTISAAGLNFYNLTFSGNETTLSLSTSMNVYGTLSLAASSAAYASTLNGNTVFAYGPVTASNRGFKGTTLIKLVGTSSRTISGVANANIPDFEIATSGGTSTFSGTVQFNGNFTYTSGVVDFGTSTVSIAPDWQANKTISALGLNFNNLSFGGNEATINLLSDISVYGTLTLVSSPFTSYLNGYTISAYGNMTTAGVGAWGSTLISMKGSADATLSCGHTRFPGSEFRIAKDPGFKVSLSSTCSFSTSGQDLTVESGTLDLAGFNLTVPDYLTVNAGASLTANGGTYSPNSGIKYICNGTCTP